MFTHKENHNLAMELTMHIAVSVLSLYLLFGLLPTVLPVYKWLYLSAFIIVLLMDGYFLVTKHQNLLKVNRMVIFYLGAILLLVLAIFYMTKMIVLTNTYGFEGLLKEQQNTAKFIFFFISFAQPILLPIPEAVTVPGASAVLGSATAVAIAFLGTMLGITVMFFVARYGGRKFISKFIKEEQLEKYQNYVSKNETLIMFLLFIVPILPDEIICVGAGIGQVSPKKFLLIASVSKFITATLLAYSVQLASALPIPSSQLIIGFLASILICIGISLLTRKILNKERGL
ncbi:VTT domain-containing protein [Mesobacillus subterraneus]|uniref:TVP38/TMEM64 family protein n=1 Tax=Mesobacillus subterraneus TaxID=285983 RepID=UPI001CFCFA09|nr:VTT domain-containing protein [Mesobacillus subterraneus]WLR54522.1 VTT domain-containing protein [Mesobacillus subterraneus]